VFTRVIWAAGGITAGIATIALLNAFTGWDVPTCFANAGGIATVLCGDLAEMLMRRQARG
jgi:hypothetical protein